MMAAMLAPIDLLARYYLDLADRVDALERKNEDLQRDRVAQAQEISALRLALIAGKRSALAELLPSRKRVEPPALVEIEPPPKSERSRRKRSTASITPVPLSKRDPAIADRWRKLSFA